MDTKAPALTENVGMDSDRFNHLATESDSEGSDCEEWKALEAQYGNDREIRQRWKPSTAYRVEGEWKLWVKQVHTLCVAVSELTRPKIY